MVFVRKSQLELGVHLCGGNLHGVFVAEVEDDSPAKGPDGLVPGDLILEVSSERSACTSGFFILILRRLRGRSYQGPLGDRQEVGREVGRDAWALASFRRGVLGSCRQQDSRGVCSPRSPAWWEPGCSLEKCKSYRQDDVRRYLPRGLAGFLPGHRGNENTAQLCAVREGSLSLAPPPWWGYRVSILLWRADRTQAGAPALPAKGRQAGSP